MSSAKLMVMAGEEFACIRVIGKADFNLALSFKALTSELHQKSFSYFVIELSECLIMDSTFLGVLSGFGLKLSQHHGCDGQPAIELLNPNERILDLLDTLGVLYLFHVKKGSLDPSILEKAQPCATEKSSKVDVTRACLEAHRVLMEINPRNVEKFKDVTAFLAEDLKRLNRES